MNSIEWIASFVINGPLPIFEAGERLKSVPTFRTSNDDADETLQSELAVKSSKRSISESAKAARKARQPALQRAYRERQRAKALALKEAA